MPDENVAKGGQLKKPYDSPRLVVQGNIEQITLGEGWGFRDFFVYGINDVIGKPGTGS